MLHATLLEANKLYHFLFLSAQTLERIHSTKLVFYAKKITQKLEFLFPQVSTHHFAKISSPLECSLLHSLTTSLKYRRACSLHLCHKFSGQGTILNTGREAGTWLCTILSYPWLCLYSLDCKPKS